MIRCGRHLLVRLMALRIWVPVAGAASRCERRDREHPSKNERNIYKKVKMEEKIDKKTGAPGDAGFFSAVKR